MITPKKKTHFFLHDGMIMKDSHEVATLVKE